MARDDGFDVQDLIACYRQGVFPMADARDDARIFLVDPDRRGILPLENFHLPRRLARTVRANTFTVKADTAFEAVVEACARERLERPETWINRPIQQLYCDLYRTGAAHSVECWLDGELVGGLYGVSLGGAFFGESMFSFVRDASKVALAHLVARMKVGGYRLLDAQFMSHHLAQFGAREIARGEYRRRLALALKQEADFYLFSGDGAAVLQAISQAS